MKHSLILGVFIARFAFFVVAQIPVNESCPTQCNNNCGWNLQDLVGIWYLQKYVSFFVDKSVKCTYWNATHVEGNKVIANLYFRTVA